MKFETAQIHFLGDVFAAVAVVVVTPPNERHQITLTM